MKLGNLRTLSRKAADLWRNSDGSWTARIFEQTFSGTYEACTAWLRNQGEAY